MLDMQNISHDLDSHLENFINMQKLLYSIHTEISYYKFNINQKYQWLMLFMNLCKSESAT